MNNNEFSDFCNTNGIEYTENLIMSEHTTFKIGGAADFYCEPKNLDELKCILKFCRNNSFPFFILGNGSNILVSDDGVEGVVISLKFFDSLNLNSAVEISCGAGVKLSKLCTFALENTLSGLEFAWGIPGTVGGAVYMNAGAYNSDISAVIKECVFLDESGNVVQADVSSLNLLYRSSIFTGTDKVIISAKFVLIPERRENIKALMDDLMTRRKSKQPLEFPSAGSTFKRPTGYYAGALIEECGLKGLSVGGAAVSDKHAGFIINTGNATSRDVITLINKIKDDVFLEKSVSLEPEVKLIGRF